MGQFADLLPTQERVLRTLGEYYLEKEVSTWLVSAAKGGACLIARDGLPTTNGDGVPASRTFYLGLKQRG